MDKFIGAILMGLVIVICFYMVMNLDKLNDLTIPVSDKFIEYFKVKPFNSDSNFNISTTTPEL